MKKATLTAIFMGALLVDPVMTSKAADDRVDTALCMSIDVSGSVDAARYKLQMEGIAEALEDPAVVAAITNGPKGGIMFSMVTWADRSNIVVGWRRIVSREDAAAVAAIIRKLPKQSGDFTCLGRMLHVVSGEIIPSLPVPASRIIVDVSGDGIDNCTDPDALAEDRDAVLAEGATINGLPIIVPGENDVVGTGAFRAPGYGLKEVSRDPDHDATTLDRWYRDHVVGGPNWFVLVARGYGDFARALRLKLVTEISTLKVGTIYR